MMVPLEDGFLIFTNSNLPVFSSVACVFGFISTKALLNRRSRRFTPVFSPIGLAILALIFRSVIHLELIFAYGGRQGLPKHFQLFQYYFFSPLNFFGHSCRKQLTLHTRIYF